MKKMATETVIPLLNGRIYQTRKVSQYPTTIQSFSVSLMTTLKAMEQKPEPEFIGICPNRIRKT
ncbi:MAG: hypothetical protein ABIP80_00585 [Ferruginibacter sp.]